MPVLPYPAALPQLTPRPACLPCPPPCPHQDNFKLKKYLGNLSKFVQQRPEVRPGWGRLGGRAGGPQHARRPSRAPLPSRGAVWPAPRQRISSPASTRCHPHHPSCPLPAPCLPPGRRLLQPGRRHHQVGAARARLPGGALPRWAGPPGCLLPARARCSEGGLHGRQGGCLACGAPPARRVVSRARRPPTAPSPTPVPTHPCRA